jgi:N-acetylglutamate synthase/N-acetylornithine aminotransferase
MTRTILAIGTAFLAVMTVFASAAEACISCEHVPVVVRSSSTSYTATRYTKKRFYARSIARAKARARTKARARAIAAARGKAKARAIAAAKAKARTIAAAKAAAAEEVELTETAAIENSTISTASLDKSETIDTEETLTEEPKINRNVGCKKFFPSVGMTLTVPCE